MACQVTPYYISTLNGSAICPIVTIGSGELIFQLGTISEVASQKFNSNLIYTCPLYGMPLGITTSNAEIRSVNNHNSILSMLYTSHFQRTYFFVRENGNRFLLLPLSSFIFSQINTQNIDPK